MKSSSTSSQLFQKININQEDRKILNERITQVEMQTIQQQFCKTKQFIQRHQKGQKQIFFLTSGGTSVPLQKNTVRMLQNFSTGQRGSIIAQQILQQNYPLIFFYRDTSFLPFLSNITASNVVLSQDDKQCQKIINARNKLKQYSQNVLLLPYKSIYHYLYGVLILKQILPYKSILVLCAAVSDFIPEEVALHKIHTQQNLQLRFRSSPKILGSLVDDRHATISFKLETDNQKLNDRMLLAIQKYNIDMVVGNILNNKKWVKIMYNPSFGKQNSLQFQQKIQFNIVKSAIRCLQIKFNK